MLFSYKNREKKILIYFSSPRLRRVKVSVVFSCAEEETFVDENMNGIVEYSE